MERCVILFGGTFDPVHKGHVMVAEYALRDIGADKVVFIPAKRSPHKDFFPVANAGHRIEMISLAIRGKDSFEVSACELDRAEPSYTIDTVMSFRTGYGRGTQLYWLVGADAVGDLVRWHRIGALINICNLSVMFRAGRPRPDFADLQGPFGAERVAKLQENVISTPLIDISSSDVRRRLRCGEDVRDMLDERVLDYIKKNGLYGT